MKSNLFTLLILSISACLSKGYSQNKILFDATKAEMAGNADWVIDADTHNINFTSTGTLVLSGGNESNPQRIPTPAQSGITTSTAETYWEGSLSHWAIDCVNQGYTVETLPYNGVISYGNSSNVQDLSNYKVFVIDEPNIMFTAAEKTALVNFVANGGGLMMICDHTVSDRNNDGNDSPMVWNDLMTNNSVQANPFGITFDLANISGIYSNIAPLPTNTILHGSWGNVTQVKWTSGTTMTLNTTNNSSAKGLVYKTGTSGLTNVVVAQATYQNGKVVAVGDSSIPDDGTGDPNDTLYNGYITDAAGNHQKLLMNAIIWLMTSSTAAANQFDANDMNVVIAPNPVQNGKLNVHYSLSTSDAVSFSIYDSLGRLMTTANNSNSNSGINQQEINVTDLQSGIYFCKIDALNSSKTIQFILN